MKTNLSMKTLFLALCFMSIYGFGQTDQTDDFVTTWKTDNAGTSNNTSITIPTVAGPAYNYAVDWNNDGTFDETGITGSIVHDYGTAGTYTIRIRGLFPRIYFNNTGDKDKILAVTQWGSNPWTSMQDAFYGCSNFNGVASDVPNLSNVASLSAMFSNATSFNQPINDWDVSSVTNMYAMLYQASAFNQPLDGWNAENVTTMYGMFYEAFAFNQPINSWNVSSVTNMYGMFSRASSFNQELNGWNVSNVKEMGIMFLKASSFNQPLGTWDLRSVTNMEDILSNTGLSIDNYDATLTGWKENSNTPRGITLGASGLKYCAAESDRNYLTDTKNWTITGDSKDCDTDPTNDFVTTWKTNNSGTSNNTSITIPTFSGETYNYAVDWNDDGTFEETGITGDATHDYETAGTYTVRIKGLFPRIDFSNRGDKEKILAVNQWGNNPWTSMEGAFRGCVNFNEVASDVPNLSNVTSLSAMFAGASSFNQPLKDWDVSSAKDMYGMFFECSSFNQPLNDWDVSKVTNMSSMFYKASSFNQPLGTWDLRSVATMEEMLDNTGLSTTNYDATLTGWKENSNTPSNITLGANGLQYCAAESVRLYLTGTKNWTINGDSKFCDTDPTDDFVITFKIDNAVNGTGSFTIPTFPGETYNYELDVTNDGTFELSGITGPMRLNGPAGTYTIRIRGLFPRIYFNNTGSKDQLLVVNQWGTNPWTSMGNAFYGCSNFNGVASDIPNLSDVTSLSAMFAGASSFNQPLNDWDVSSVTNMYGMFFEDSSFNQPLNDWDVSKVTTMSLMLYNASSFNQPLGTWDLRSVVTTMEDMIFGTAISIDSYDATLIGWKENSNTPSNMTLGANGLQYCAAESARFYLIDTKKWTINGDSKSCDTDPADDFVTTWKTDNEGTSNNTSIIIPTFAGATYNYAVDWDNDGTFEETGITGDATHDYGTVGTYTIRIKGVFPRIYFNEGDKDKILAVDQWGTNPWTSMEDAFYGCSNFNGVASDVPNLSNVTSLSAMFAFASTFNQPLNDWDVSSVTNMYGMFSRASSFNKPLNDWNVRKVTSMSLIFNNASSFNQPLGNWDLSSVKNMENMLDNAGLSMTNYDATLKGWRDNTNTPSDITLGATGLKYCAAESDRNYLIGIKNWVITGDTKDCTSLSTADDILANGLKLYPNPTTGYITVEGLENMVRSTIYNIQGQKIKEKIENNKINLENVPAGMYLLKIETEKGIVTKKIIKK